MNCTHCQEPLPDGKVQAFRIRNDENLYDYVGRTSVKYIPINETVELELGPDQEVMVKARLMDWQKLDLRFSNGGNVAGWTTRETWEFELQNSKDIEVVVDIRRNFKGDWEMQTEDSYEKVNAKKVKFVAPLKPKAKKTIRYVLTTYHGINVRK